MNPLGDAIPNRTFDTRSSTRELEVSATYYRREVGDILLFYTEYEIHVLFHRHLQRKLVTGGYSLFLSRAADRSALAEDLTSLDYEIEERRDGIFKDKKRPKGS